VTAINMTHLLSDALATEWMMTREACHALKRIYMDALGTKSEGRHLTISDIERLWAKHESEGLGEAMHLLRDEESRMAAQTEPMKGTSYTSLYKNVAIIDILGPIVPRVRGMSSGTVGAQQIKNDFITAFEDDNVKAILFNVDSPGGDARGISELAQTVAKARAKNTKPIHAYAAGYMASAAYFISAGAHRIVTNDWGTLGSIGVVVAVPPKMEGDDIEFVNTESPYKRPDTATDEGKGVYQQKADYMGGLFIDAVANLRGVTREKVVEDFGRGGTLVGRQAVKAGLADAIGTFDGALHALVTHKPLDGARASASENGETGMSEKKWYQKIFAGLSADERKEALATLGESDAQPDASLREKAAAFDKLISEQRTKDAETFAKETIAAHKAFPLSYDKLKAEFELRAKDDERDPLSSGSRVETLRAIFNELPAHNLTTELAAGQLPPGATVLQNDPDPHAKLIEETRNGAREWAKAQTPQPV
jgi:ClpP class serine protease